MSIGIIIRNSNSEIQIDGEYQNLSHAESGTSSIAGAGSETQVAIASSPAVPLILIQPGTDRFVCAYSYLRTGSNWNAFYAIAEYGASTTINWQCHRIITAPSSETFGLRVRDRKANIVFDSGKLYFRIGQIFTESLSSPTSASAPSVDLSHPNYSNPFYILTPIGFWRFAEFTGQQTIGAWYKLGLKKLTATSVRVGWFDFRPINLPGNVASNSGYNPTFNVIVCEV